MVHVRIIGPGRAGQSFATALRAAGWTVDLPLGRADDVVAASAGCDLLLLAVPDAAVEAVAASVRTEPDTVVAHVSGSLGLEPLGSHPRRAVLHPLVALPDPVIGAERLRGAWYGLATDGDPLARDAVDALAGRSIAVAEDRWALYHAAAAIASNHLVGLLGQVERVAEAAGAPLEAYLDLVRQTVENVARLGPATALTGPVRRGDWATVDRHLAALPEAERPGYRAMVEEVRALCP
jgi:predicted short-subunit dehydrogenase-like oxidoreductase (DUF2520 family)